MSLTLTDSQRQKLSNMFTRWKWQYSALTSSHPYRCPECNEESEHNDLCDWNYFKQLLDKHEGEE